MNQKEEARAILIQALKARGCPEEFGAEVARNLGSEKAMNRMSGYLSHFRTIRPEEIADEMIAIMEERQIRKNKKAAEYYNSRYNEMLLRGFDDEEE